jgi:hypothetical protein
MGSLMDLAGDNSGRSLAAWERVEIFPAALRSFATPTQRQGLRVPLRDDFGSLAGLRLIKQMAPPFTTTAAKCRRTSE